MDNVVFYGEDLYRTCTFSAFGIGAFKRYNIHTDLKTLYRYEDHLVYSLGVINDPDILKMRTVFLNECFVCRVFGNVVIPVFKTCKLDHEAMCKTALSDIRVSSVQRFHSCWAIGDRITWAPSGLLSLPPDEATIYGSELPGWTQRLLRASMSSQNYWVMTMLVFGSGNEMWHAAA
jgi:hypothetical protein